MRNATELINDLNVAIYHDSILRYPTEMPYSPHIKYPEYPFRSLSQKENNVYDAVRNTLLLLGLDKGNFGTPSWNPLNCVVKPGDTVVIKPNFVLDRHDEDGDLFSIITHPSVIRATVDYVYIALKGRGRIIIADAPQMDCNFTNLLSETGLETIRELYKNEREFNIEIYDLRNFWLDRNSSPKGAYSKNRHELPGDPLGGVHVNLGKESLFYKVDSFKKFYGADYDRKETIRHHHGDVQEYLVSKTILSADVVISVPKLKVHKKVGVTLNIKGLVGIAVNKNYLVHYKLGIPSEGGDQFPDGVLKARERATVKLQRWVYDKLLSKKNSITDALYDMAVRVGKPLLKSLGFGLDKDKSILDGGNWYGNDSAWRMAVDLLRIFIYADREGHLHDAPMRRMFSIVDGVIGGERNGPLTPDSKRCGGIVAGFNPCAVDAVCTRLMGFDYKKIKMLSYVLDHPEVFRTVVSQIALHSNNKEFDNLFIMGNKARYFDFEPHPGWKGFIEIG